MERKTKAVATIRNFKILSGRETGLWKAGTEPEDRSRRSRSDQLEPAEDALEASLLQVSEIE
jgi:hypothetical protein